MNTTAIPASTQAVIARRIRQDVQSLHAYNHAGLGKGMVKLDAMENPYPLSADLQAALGQRLGGTGAEPLPRMAG